MSLTVLLNPPQIFGHANQESVCYVCGNTQNNKHYTVREMMFDTKEEFDYFECSTCGCLQISNPPKDLGKYYPDNYLCSAKRTEVPLSRLSMFFRNKSNRYALFKDSFIGKLVNLVYPNSLKSYSIISKAPLDLNSHILDVGCGSGGLIYALRNLGFKNLLGCDPFIKEDITYSNGLQILKKPVEEVKGEWDLIMFNESFEHIPNQKETLQATSNTLAKNGVCLISMPVVPSYAWKQYGVNWVQLDAPRHLVIHSTVSIKMLAEKSSLKIFDTVYNSNAFQFWGSELYLRNMPLHSKLGEPTKITFTKKQFREYGRKAKELNKQSQGDRAVFYLKAK
jgi:SAM-dependent methyltransferase